MLEALATGGRPVRLSHLATQLGMQKSSVHRVLQTLTEWGYVTREPTTDLYVATLKTWELGTAVVSGLPVKQAATAVLQELHRRTGETVSLTVLDGDDVLYLDKIIAARPVGFTTRVGSRVAAPLAVVGPAMLAYHDDARGVIERVSARCGPDVLDVDEALDEVRRAREDGYFIGHGHPPRGITATATAVPGPGGRAIAGLTVSAPSSRIDDKKQQEIVDALLLAAATLGESVGHG